MTRLLILGGTGEAVALARAAAPKFEVTTSLAGVTRDPVLPPGEIHRGGFGGSDGLAAYLRANGIDAVIDATHPFAAAMSRNAVAACARMDIPLLRLIRPAWTRQSGDAWIEVRDATAAAAAITADRVFLTTGLRDLDAFAVRSDVWFLVRSIERPARVPLARYALIQARGPFDEAAETELIRHHRLETLVAKNSGGDATYAKIAAARRLGLSVIMIARPVLPEAETVSSVDAALKWLRHTTPSMPMDARVKPGHDG